jgi:hypothetical protein
MNWWQVARADADLVELLTGELEQLGLDRGELG